MEKRNPKMKHVKRTNGFESWARYDARGNEIYYKDNSGTEYWFEYDDKGNILSYRNNNGYWYKNEYCEYGVCYTEFSNGNKEWKDYDRYGRVILKMEQTSLGMRTHTYFKYDDEGNLLKVIGDDGNIRFEKRYDEYGNIIYNKYGDGYEENIDYVY